MKHAPDAIDRYESRVLAHVVAIVESRRVEQGLTIEALARRSELAPRTITYMMKLQKRASLRTMLQLLNAVGLSLSLKVVPLRSAVAVVTEERSDVGIEGAHPGELPPGNSRIPGAA